MKKNILLITMLIFLTGCSVNYNLKFNKDTIEENITINVENEQEKQNTKYFENRDFYAIIDAKTESQYRKEKDKNSNYNFSYEYSLKDFKNSRFTSCYDAYTLTDDDGIISLNTSKKFKCLTYDYNNIDNLTINITTDYKVVETNADEVEGNTYKWNINKNNSENKPIKFSYNVNKKRRITLSEFLKENKLSIIIALIALSLFVLITISIYIKHKRVNKI